MGSLKKLEGGIGKKSGRKINNIQEIATGILI